MALSDETPHLHQSALEPPTGDCVSVCGSSDGPYLLMEIDSGSSGGPPCSPHRSPVLSAWPHHFSPWLNVLVLSSEAVGWVVTCLLTPPSLPPFLLLLPEKTSAPLQTTVLTARRGEMESSHPRPQAVLYSNSLLVKSPLQTMVLLCCSQRLSKLMCVRAGRRV